MRVCSAECTTHNHVVVRLSPAAYVCTYTINAMGMRRAWVHKARRSLEFPREKRVVLGLHERSSARSRAEEHDEHISRSSKERAFSSSSRGADNNSRAKCRFVISISETGVQRRSLCARRIIISNRVEIMYVSHRVLDRRRDVRSKVFAESARACEHRRLATRTRRVGSAKMNIAPHQISRMSQRGAKQKLRVMEEND